MASIFKSKIKLTFRRAEIEKEYGSTNEQSITSYIRQITIFTTLLSCIPSTMVAVLFNTKNESDLKAVGIISFVVSALYSLLLFVTLFTKNKKILRIVNYINYYFLAFILLNVNYLLINYLKVSKGYITGIFSLEVFVRMVWLLLGLHGFFESLVICILSSLTIWPLYVTLVSNEFDNIVTLLIARWISMLLVVAFNYFIERNSRKVFYLNFYNKKKTTWLNNVFNKMDSGFFSVGSRKINYINSFLIAKIKKWKIGRFIQDSNGVEPKLTENVLITCEENQKHNLNAEKLITELIRRIDVDSLSIYFFILDEKEYQETIFKLKEELYDPSTKNITKILTDCINKIAKDDFDFNYLGQVCLETEDDKEQYFEFYVRSNNTFNYDNDENQLEFLMVDVTRVMLNEKQKLELKYKSLFLSKVAHEFKNPLICMNEIIKQTEALKETHNIKIPDEVGENLVQIKSMSNFLLVLVKDLDYFSQTQMEKKAELETNKFKVEEFQNFCNEIAKSLLNKYNKTNQIKFKIETSENFPKSISADEWRLKQIIINLISNAVKFTYTGEITLIMKLIDNEIHFSVKDTGVGIKEEKRQSIFTPFGKDVKKNNELGAGLGLSIVSELVKILGDEIKLKSDASGTEFSFKIRENINTKMTSSVHLSGTNSIICPDEIDDSNTTILKEFNPRMNDSLMARIIRRLSDESKIKSNLNVDKQIASFIKNENTNKINRNKIPKIKCDEEVLSPIKESISLNTNVGTVLQESFICNYSSIEDFAQWDLNLDWVNILIVDDEKFTRMATIRIVREVAKKENLKIKIYEAEDGVESIFIVYKCICKGIRISMILSDETMNYVKGSTASQVIGDFLDNKGLPAIPFYLVTALDSLDINRFKYIKELIPKPASKSKIQKIISKSL